MIPRSDAKDEPKAETDAATTDFIAFVKATLGGAVQDVRASDRLTDSAVCLVAPETGIDRQLEKILAGAGRLKAAVVPILEINPSHALIASLAKLGDDEKALKEDAAHLLFDEARVLDGERPADPRAFAERLARVLGRADAQGRVNSRPLLNRAPHPLRRVRHLDLAHVQRLQRIEHRIGQRRDRAGRAGLARALGAQRIERRRHAAIDQRDRRQVFRARHEVIHEGAGQELAGVRIVGDVLAEHLADALHQSAVQLPLDQRVADDVAAIVGRHVVDDLRLAGVRIDLDLGDVRAARVGERECRTWCWCRADGSAGPTSSRSAS